MGVCAWCGNDYDKTFTVTLGEQTFVFDAFECAISLLAPQCGHCGCRILGHGLESQGRFYSCASCAQHAGVTGLRDRLDVQPHAAEASGSTK